MAPQADAPKSAAVETEVHGPGEGITLRDKQMAALKLLISLLGDRLSTESLRANQLRLYFSSLAYVLVEALRRIGLAGTEWAEYQVETIRLRLLKIALLSTDENSRCGG